jgi:hypothetical protein
VWFWVTLRVILIYAKQSTLWLFQWILQEHRDSYQAWVNHRHNFRHRQYCLLCVVSPLRISDYIHSSSNEYRIFMHVNIFLCFSGMPALVTYRAKYKYIHFEGSLYILAAFNRSTSRFLEKPANVLSYLSSKQNLIESTKRLLKILEWQSKACYTYIYFVPSRIILYRSLMEHPINTSCLTKEYLKY